MVVAAERLTQELLDEHGAGLANGRALRFIADTRAGKIYVLREKPVESHVLGGMALTGLDDLTLRDYPEKAEHLVGCYVETHGDEVSGVYIGFSTIEQYARVRHSKETLQKARALAEAFVRNGTVPVAKRLAIEVVPQ